MPILSFSEQPAANEVAAAYRPVILSVLANATDFSQVPPVVYCDIYFNDVFYKTLSKSQYKQLSGEASEWQFDVQDAAQEYLQLILGDFAEPTIVEAVGILTKCQCKLRSSGYDANGFITPEDTAPVQGTDSSNPVSGTGTDSNTFYIQNATLQHEDNQDLVTHLSYFKTRTWAEDAFPLSHRPNGYRVGPNSSDIFPILYTGSTAPNKIRVKYRLCGQTTFHDTDPVVPTCIIPSLATSPALPDGVEGVPYSQTIALNGTAPFTLSNFTKPAWMNISVTGNTIYVTGTPDTNNDSADPLPIEFDINNCHALGTHYSDEIDVNS
jgi:hypothetical protein